MRFSRRKFIHQLALSVGGLWLASCQPPPTPQGQATAQPQTPTPTPGVAMPGPAMPDPLPGFAAFQEHLQLRQDAVYQYVASNGLPAHLMMIGIRSWQQQVPLPQPYTGTNAWSIPLQPALAAQPVSGKTALYNGAIALAVNGVPIFNALNNRGDDAYLVGELDQWGGHAGRADDYHYHIAPLHLQEVLGPGLPIAYALDGFPIYGTTEPDGSAVTGLDEFNGHFDTAGHYHYHGTTTYPYINGGMRGVVTVRDDHIEPQPHAHPVRPALQPLAGAVITDFQVTGEMAYMLAYELNGETHYVNYGLRAGQYVFEFVAPSGATRIETYEP